MANVIDWNHLDRHMNEILYEEWRGIDRIDQCRPIEILDITHMKFQYWSNDGTSLGNNWIATAKYSPDCRYWDDMPTREERRRNWK